MIYVMQFIENKLNTKKVEPAKLASVGWKCNKCNTYFEMKDQDNEQLAYICHKDVISIYHVCLKCGARWKTVNERDQCKHR